MSIGFCFAGRDADPPGDTVEKRPVRKCVVKLVEEPHHIVRLGIQFFRHTIQCPP